MKILEKKSVEVNFTESLLRMAADDVEGNHRVLFSFLFFSFLFFIDVQIQLSPFSYHHFSLPYPRPPPTINPIPPWLHPWVPHSCLFTSLSLLSYVIMALICIPLVISDVEQLFIYLLAIRMPSLENAYVILCQFLYWMFKDFSIELYELFICVEG